MLGGAASVTSAVTAANLDSFASLPPFPSLPTAIVYHKWHKYRCITNLMTMLFLGRSGRALLITTLLSMVVAGVCKNLWSNTVRVGGKPVLLLGITL